MLIQEGLTESLAGRFEIIPISHWSFKEMREAFNFSLEQYIFFGGYPGSAHLIGDYERWRSYVIDSLIETTITKDVLMMTKISKPALLRQVFFLGCEYSGRILSYQKMLGHLQDAGNTTTLAHYLDLCDQVVMIKGMQKFSPQKLRQRSSSPRLQIYNSALLSAVHGLSLEQVRNSPQVWGQFVESAIGQHILNSSRTYHFETFYWREGNDEVDFVLQRSKNVLGIEVKSGMKKDALLGRKKFLEHYPKSHFILVGTEGIPIDRFLEEENILEFINFSMQL